MGTGSKCGHTGKKVRMKLGWPNKSGPSNYGGHVCGDNEAVKKGIETMGSWGWKSTNSKVGEMRGPRLEVACGGGGFEPQSRSPP